jgi:hypothetical protein
VPARLGGRRLRSLCARTQRGALHQECTPRPRPKEEAQANNSAPKSCLTMLQNLNVCVNNPKLIVRTPAQQPVSSSFVGCTAAAAAAAACSCDWLGPSTTAAGSPSRRIKPCMPGSSPTEWTAATAVVSALVCSRSDLARLRMTGIALCRIQSSNSSSSANSSSSTARSIALMARSSAKLFGLCRGTACPGLAARGKPTAGCG